jgi:ubiquinone biosynthesis protein COQ4
MAAALAERSDFRMDWAGALAALKKLIADKEDTVQVFRIMRALSGRSIPRGYARLLATPEGGRIAYRRVELARLLDDHDALARLPEGSVGRAYLAFVQSEDLSAAGLAAESRKAQEAAEIDAEHPLAWYARRLRDIHDLWHVLSGYHRDALGEASLVAFSYAQTRSLGFALIGAAGARQIKKALPHRPIYRCVWEAYRHGKSAAWLPGEDFERLLAEPLEAARARLNIAAPATYRAIPEIERSDAMAPAEALAAAA